MLWYLLTEKIQWSQMGESPNSTSPRKKETGKKQPCPAKGACLGALGSPRLRSAPLCLAGAPRVRILAWKFQSQSSFIHTKLSKDFGSGTLPGQVPRDEGSLNNMKEPHSPLLSTFGKSRTRAGIRVRWVNPLWMQNLRRYPQDRCASFASPASQPCKDSAKHTTRIPSLNPPTILQR